MPKLSTIQRTVRVGTDTRSSSAGADGSSVEEPKAPPLYGGATLWYSTVKNSFTPVRMNLTHVGGEFAGTFVLVLVILGVGYSLAVGATLAGIVYFLSTTSGGHVNPAVSLAMWLRGAIDTEKFISYIVAQCAGAATAYGVARVVNF